MRRDHDTTWPRQEIDASDERTHASIREQVNRIVGHEEFRATDRIREFLQFVVEETLAGRSDQLKGFTIAREVFGRGLDFDAAQDPVVRTQAGRLRQALERYYLVSGTDDPIHIDIPKGRYVPRLSTLAGGTDLAHPSGSASDLVMPDWSARPVLAVRPLQSLVDDPEQQLFAIGLTEELVTELGCYANIVTVASRFTSQAPGSSADPQRPGAATASRFVLGGTTRRDSESLKVSVYLEDTKNGEQIWAKAYKQPLEAGHLIHMQEEIARNVVEMVASEYGVIANRLYAETRKKAPAALSTYESMLCYYAFLATFAPDAGERCAVLLRQAVEREPLYGPIWSALADLQCIAYENEIPGAVRPLETALEYARRGVALAPDYQPSRTVLAHALSLAGERVELEEQLEIALALNPNSTLAMAIAAHCLSMVGEFARARALMESALAASPYHPYWYHLVLFMIHYHEGDYDRALLDFEHMRFAEDHWVLVLGIAAHGNLDRPDEAEALVEQLAAMKPDFAPRAHELISRCVKDDSLVEALMDGLRRGGLPVECRA